MTNDLDGICGLFNENLKKCKLLLIDDLLFDDDIVVDTDNNVYKNKKCHKCKPKYVSTCNISKPIYEPIEEPTCDGYNNKCETYISKNSLYKIQEILFNAKHDDENDSQ